MGNILPLNLIRVTNKETHLGKYTIPKVETHSKVIISPNTLLLKRSPYCPYYPNSSNRVPWWWPPWTLFFMMSLCGKRPTPSTLNTSWIRTARLERERPSCPFQLVCIYSYCSVDGSGNIEAYMSQNSNGNAICNWQFIMQLNNVICKYDFVNVLENVSANRVWAGTTSLPQAWSSTT